MTEEFDLIVIGGGRASSLAMAAAEEGWKVALLERNKLGGTCPNRGCVPSKLLIGFADAARSVREAGRHYIDADLRTVELEKIFASVNTYVAGVDGRYEDRIKSAGVKLIRGEGHFTGPNEVTVGERILKAGKFVIATGSKPAPPPTTAPHVWTSDDLFPLKGRPPRSLIVIGGGVIGCEMAAFFAAVGVETSLHVRGDRLLRGEDAEIEQVFQTEFGKSVVTFLRSELRDLQYNNGRFTASFQTLRGVISTEADQVLFAIGRLPNSDALDLGRAGVVCDENGFIQVNEHLETNVPGIFATGDVNGRYMLQHAAAQEVHYLREKFLKGETGPLDDRPIGHAVYSHPEIAAIGETEEALKASGTPYVAVLEDWLASARAEAMRIEYPRVKLLISPVDHSILGCHLIGPESSTLIHQVITVMRLKNDFRELVNTVYVHPALNECLLAAAVKAIKKVRDWKAENA